MITKRSLLIFILNIVITILNFLVILLAFKVYPNEYFGYLTYFLSIFAYFEFSSDLNLGQTYIKKKFENKKYNQKNYLKMEGAGHHK